MPSSLFNNHWAAEGYLNSLLSKAVVHERRLLFASKKVMVIGRETGPNNLADHGAHRKQMKIQTGTLAPKREVVRTGIYGFCH